ncbi:methyltransferase [Rheinheimera sp.]|uniref:tRNA1(Val) (adenine(37)-N6)-methyltransferase n=1 Tax=Rheinheimera sp. TaxID=1869214 RepID=UPI00307EA527
MNQGFRCKEFFVAHDLCAMKVSTDSLLLGAWLRLPVSAPSLRLLDIGCGSGLLSLMLAQRLAAAQMQYQIDAVEIDSMAAMQAGQNVQASPWAPQIQVIQADILTYATADHHVAAYQLLVSNPPYFENSLKSEESRRAQARHTDSLPLLSLLQVSARLATASASLALVLPASVAETLVPEALQQGWHLHRLCRVSEREGKAARLWLMQFKRTPGPCESNALLIRDAQGQYSQAYRLLLADFYLKF